MKIKIESVNDQNLAHAALLGILNVSDDAPTNEAITRELHSCVLDVTENEAGDFVPAEIEVGVTMQKNTLGMCLTCETARFQPPMQVEHNELVFTFPDQTEAKAIYAKHLL